MEFTPAARGRVGETAKRPRLKIVDDDPVDRKAPANVEAEQALLGAILVDNSVHSQVAGSLTADDFYDPVHAAIYDKASALIEARRPANPVTLRTYFENAEPIAPDMSVPQYLGKLAANATSTVNAPPYAQIIIDLGRKRQAIVASEDLTRELFDPNSDVDGALKRYSERLQGLAPKQSDQNSLDGRPAFTPKKWAGNTPPPREWIAPGLPGGEPILATGDGGTGKSLLYLGVVAALAIGRPVFGGPPRPPMTCLYVSAEDDEDELWRRLAAWARHFDRPLEDFARLHLVDLSGADAVLGAQDRLTGLVSPTERYRELERMIDALDVKVLVLDSQADIFTGSEIDRQVARQSIGLLRRLCREYGVTIIIIGHPSESGMANGSGKSGSTAWHNSVRSRLYFTSDAGEGGRRPDDDLRILSSKKSNYGPRGFEMRFRWKDGVFVPADGGMPEDAVARETRADQTFLDLLRVHRRTNQDVSAKPSANYAPARFAEHPENPGVGKDEFKASLQRLLSAGTIKSVTFGPPSRPLTRLVITGEDEQ